MSPDTVFCSLPFNTVQAFANGQVSPCCVFRPKTRNTIETYFDSNELAQVRNDFLNGEFPSQCQVCKIEESKSGHSFRVLNNLFESDEIEIRAGNRTIKHLQIETSNTCNLKCLPCHDSSYIRAVELKKLNLLPYTTPRIVEYHKLDEYLKLDNIESITFSGGEPFADKITFEFIHQLVQSGKSLQIRIDINTNLTLVNLNNLKYLQDNFKEVLIKGSIDGYGIVNDYLRYPSEWQQITDAVSEIQELKIPFIITTALSNLALVKYYELIEWATEQGIEKLFVSLVTSPGVLDPTRLPDSVKAQLLAKYQNLKNTKSFSNRTQHVIDSCIHLCNTPNITNFDQTKIYLRKHDDLRGTDFTKIWLELNDY
jgi:organic radical activating enzyme